MFRKIKLGIQPKIFTLLVLEDIFRLMLISLFLILIFEGILPGIITDRINITYLLLISAIIFIGIQKIYKLTKMTDEGTKKINRWLMPTILSFFSLLIIQSLYKFGIVQIIFIGTVTAAIYFIIHREFITKE